MRLSAAALKVRCGFTARGGSRHAQPGPLATPVPAKSDGKAPSDHTGAVLFFRAAAIVPPLSRIALTFICGHVRAAFLVLARAFAKKMRAEGRELKEVKTIISRSGGESALKEL